MKCKFIAVPVQKFGKFCTNVNSVQMYRCANDLQMLCNTSPAYNRLATDKTEMQIMFFFSGSSQFSQCFEKHIFHYSLALVQMLSSIVKVLFFRVHFRQVLQMLHRPAYDQLAADRE